MSVAVVTGAASGMGRACAERFIAEGWQVAALDRADADVGGALAVAADVTDAAAVTVAIERVVAELGAPKPRSSTPSRPCVRRPTRRVVRVRRVGGDLAARPDDRRLTLDVHGHGSALVPDRLTYRRVSGNLRSVATYQVDCWTALGDPTRRAIFERLVDGPLAVGDLASEFPVSRPAVSQHLKVLKDARLVVDRPVGNRRIYAVDPTGLGALRADLDRFWGQALANYKRVVEQQTKEDA